METSEDGVRKAKGLQDRCLEDVRFLYRSSGGRDVVGGHVGNGNKQVSRYCWETTRWIHTLS